MSAVLALAEIHYSPTITLGAAIIGGIGGLALLYRLFVSVGLRTANEIQTRRIDALEGDIGDKDRRLEDKDRRLDDLGLRLRELGVERDTALASAAACDATVATLKEQIEHMPKYEDVIAFGTEQMRAVNDAAASRQEEFLRVVIAELKLHDNHVESIHRESERRAGERHGAQLKAMDAIVNRLNGGAA